MDGNNRRSAEDVSVMTISALYMPACHPRNPMPVDLGRHRGRCDGASTFVSKVMESDMNHPIMIRINPFGELAIWKCDVCGKTGTTAEMRVKLCTDSTPVTDNELIAAIEGMESESA